MLNGNMRDLIEEIGCSQIPHKPEYWQWPRMDFGAGAKLISPHIGEANQHALYARWAEVMSASSWDQIKIEPRTRVTVS